MFRSKVSLVLVILTFVTGLAFAGDLEEGEIDLFLDLDGNLGEYVEGVAVDKKGNVFASITPLGKVWKITTAGDVSVLCDGLFGVLGLAVDPPRQRFCCG